MTPRLLTLRLAALATLALATLAWSGCGSLDVTAKIPADAVARLSPAPQIATPYQAVEFAKHYVSEHPGSDFAIGNGDSMMPLYHDRDVIILERPALENLKIGQTVMFMSDRGIPVAHIVVSHSPHGWVTRGLNNDECDPGALRDSIYMGVVVKAFRPTDSPILAYWKTSPQNAYASNP